MTIPSAEPAAFTHDDYRSVLQCARSTGWAFESFAAPRALSETGRTCLLRHDCDNDLLAAHRMATIEAGEGVRATYFVMLRAALYNLLAPTYLALVREITAMGHWLGLHFDEAPFRDATDDELSVQVERERLWIEAEFCTAVQAISFHQPGPRVLRNRIKLPCVSTYDREHFRGFTYVSDSNMRNDGRALRNLLTNATSKRIHVLVHPEWWTADSMPIEAKWNAMYSNAFLLMQKSLLSREATYSDPRSFEIKSRGAGRRDPG